MLLATLVWVWVWVFQNTKKKISFWVWIEYKFKKIRKKNKIDTQIQYRETKNIQKMHIYKFSVF